MKLLSPMRTGSKHGVPRGRWRTGAPYAKTSAWVLAKPKRYARPKPYEHPQGAVIWVNI